MRERDKWRNTVDQSGIRCLKGTKSEEKRGGKKKIERVCRIIELYMVTVEVEVFSENEK